MSNLTWWQILPPKIQELIHEGLPGVIDGLEEIRLRIKRPLLLRLNQTEISVTPEKRFTNQLEKGYVIEQAEVEKTIQIISQDSFYAWEEEFKNGYLTIPGGHRVGFVGKCILENGKIKTLKEPSGINLRIGRQILGCANMIIPHLLEKKDIKHTLIISPPQCGKTTLLRDLIRQISTGIPAQSFRGLNVGLVDERSEIAAMYQGIPQFQIGLRTDVLDACPKAQGMMLLIRAMSPAVIATDEIGKKEDIEAIHNVLQAGVKVITTVHGSNFAEIKTKPYLQTLLNWRFFERIIILSRRDGVGTLEMILDGQSLERLV